MSTTVIIPFPTPAGGVASALVRVAAKRTVRFVRRERRDPPPPPRPDYADPRLIDGARVTALNYRRLAEKTTDRRAKQRLLDRAARWDERAEKLTVTMHGPQQAAGELFAD